MDASPPVVPVVTVPFSDASVDCEVVFSGSDRKVVEPHSFLSRKRDASAALECETDMYFGRLPVKVLTEAARNKPTPKYVVQSSSRICKKQSDATTRRNASATNGDLAWSTSI